MPKRAYIASCLLVVFAALVLVRTWAMLKISLIVNIDVSILDVRANEGSYVEYVLGF
jgi:hypothetical protein